MIHVAVLPRRVLARWARSRTKALADTAYRSPKPLPRKDFSIVPVCGAVRPPAAQRQLSQRT